MSGYLRAYATSDDSQAEQRVTASTLVATIPSPSQARLLWAVGTARDYATVNGVPAHGGSDERTRPTVADGMLYVNSGYAQSGGLPGNVPLAFEVSNP